MSVQTTADEFLNDAKEFVDKAISDLNKVQDSWGWDDWSNEYQIKILEVILELIKIKHKIG